MTNATKTLGITLIVLLVLLGLDIGLSHTGSSEAFVGKLIDVDSADVNRILIQNVTEEASVELVKNNGSWEVKTEEEHYHADANKVKRAFSTISNFKVKSVVTRNPSKFSRFRVDSTGTLVSLFNGDKELTRFVVGAPQIQGQQGFNTYVRPAYSNETVAVEGFISSHFSSKTDEWRDKRVWKLNRGEISEIEFTFPGDSSFSMTRSGEGWYSLTDSVSQVKADRLLQKLADLNASGFTGEKPPLSEPLYQLRFTLDNGTQYALKFSPIEDESNYYQVEATGYPYIFKLSKSIWDRNVLAGRKALIVKS